MNTETKINIILISQILVFGGLIYAYLTVAPILDKTSTTLDNTNALVTKVNNIV